MTSISGTIGLTEARRTRRAIAKRTYGSEPTYVLIALGFSFVGAALGYHVLSFEPTLGTIIGGLTGFMLHPLLAERLYFNTARVRLVERGTPDPMPLRVSLTADELVYEAGDTRHLAKWHCVSDLFPSRACWVFLVNGGGWIVPCRLFVDRDAERAFIRSAIQLMSDAARARSAQAVKFAETRAA